MSNTNSSSGLPSLAGAEWLENPITQSVFGVLGADGHEVRAVGGVVRNTLMGKSVRDIDLATTAHPDVVMLLAEKAGLKAVPTGIVHGTVTVIADGQPFEVTTLREDVETFGRHAEVVFSQNWERDAARRDFTINALYAGADGTVYDPLGGYQDILDKRVRFIGDAHQRIREDFLRILRFFRFTADYCEGEVDREGLWACVSERKGLEQLSAERVRGELVRLLVSVRAFPMIEIMFQHGLLVEFIGAVPDITRLQKLVEAEAAYGLEANPVRRLGALAVRVEGDSQRLADRLRLSKAERYILENMTSCCAWISGDMDERLARARLYLLGEEAYVDQVLLALAQNSSCGDKEQWGALVSLPSRWVVPEFPLKGSDVQALGVSQGPQVGEILHAVEAWWIEQDFDDDRAGLDKRLGEEVSKVASQ